MKEKFIKIWTSNVYFRFIPFLILYLVLSYFMNPGRLVADEGRYLWFAENLTKGYYSPSAPDINLWAGPGYPLFILPLVHFKVPLIIIRLLNGVLLYISLIINFKTFSIYISKNTAFRSTILLGFYYPIYTTLPLIMTEILAWFLLSLVCFLFVKNFQENNINWKHLLFCSLSIAYLAMVKVIFGYVIFVMLLLSMSLLFLLRFKMIAKKTSLIFFFALVFCMPYLTYTYNLTNKLFFWSNVGSMSLYTMSSPFKGDLGDWRDSNELRLDPNHTVFIDSIWKLKPLERYEAYNRLAKINIRNHPQKYVSNWLANIGRLFFNYPNTNKIQSIRTYFFFPNMILLSLLVTIFPLTLYYWRKWPKELIVLTIFILVYLFGSSLVSAFPRILFITIPFWIFFITIFFTKVFPLKLSFEAFQKDYRQINKRQ